MLRVEILKSFMPVPSHGSDFTLLGAGRGQVKKLEDINYHTLRSILGYGKHRRKKKIPGPNFGI